MGGAGISVRTAAVSSMWSSGENLWSTPKSVVSPAGPPTANRARRRGEHNRLERTLKHEPRVEGRRRRRGGRAGSVRSAAGGGSGPPPAAALCCWGGQTPPPSSRDGFRCAGGVPSNVRPLMRAEARVLNLGRTSWHYDEGRRAAAARPTAVPVVRACERESCGGAMPDFSKASPTPRMPAVPSRESSLEPRPVGTVPECPALAAHTLDEDSPAYGNVSRAGDDCGVVVVKRRWHDHRPASHRPTPNLAPIGTRTCLGPV